MVPFPLFALVALVVLGQLSEAAVVGVAPTPETALGGTENLCYKVKYKVKQKQEHHNRLHG
jgi:hypothetical protein